MKSKSISSRVQDRYSMIEPLESRIAPAGANVFIPANTPTVTVTAGGSSLVTAGHVLEAGGKYLLYVAQGEVLVHTTDLNHNNAVDFNEITGLSVTNGTIVVSFVDIHGDIVTDLVPGQHQVDDNGKGDILLDANITEIDLRSLTTADFPGSPDAATQVNDHLALSSYSIFGNIYAGGGVGLASNPSSGLVFDTSGTALQQSVFTNGSGSDFYQSAVPYLGSIYVGTAASGMPFNFGVTGSPVDTFGNLLAFNPSTGEAGASVFNVGSAVGGQPFIIGTIHAGNGGFNGAGGNISNVSLNGATSGTIQLIAGDAGTGTTGHAGGSITNFSATGLIMGEVLLQSGSGGTGLIGAGGNAGLITITAGSALGINGHLVFNYGNGGNGYTAGGTGGGTPSGSVVVPDGKFTTAANLVTTTRAIGDVGTTTPFDFNGDNFSDAVFSTSNPNQLVVAFGSAELTGDSLAAGLGSEFGLNSSSYIYLNAPGNIDAIAVGNFTGLMNPVTHQPEYDIAVATGSGNYAGVYVYLSLYDTKTGAFEGFSQPLFSPLPDLVSNDDYFTSVPISKLVVGDFDGTGVMGLAVLAQETYIATGAVDNVLIYLSNETSVAHPGGTGYFYAKTNLPLVDFGTNYSANQSIFAVTALQKFTAAAPGSPSAGHDVIIEANAGAKGFDVIDDSTGFPEILATNTFGKVDTNRNVGSPNNTSLTPFTVNALAVTMDASNKNLADVVAVSQISGGFMVIEQGTGTAAGFTIISNSNQGAGNGDQNGIPITSNPVAVVAVPSSVDPTIFSDVAILNYGPNNNDSIFVENIGPTISQTTPDGFTGGAAKSMTEVWAPLSPITRDANLIAFGLYIPAPVTSSAVPGSGPDSFGFITGTPLADGEIGGQVFTVSQPYYTYTFGGVTFITGDDPTYADYKVAGVFFNGGNGGNSTAGAGGAGGSFGASLTVSGSGTSLVGVGTLGIQFPADPTYEGTAQFIAGQGGNGFTHGGNGGSLVGISVVYENPTELTGIVTMVAGNGGQSLSGTGGSGGSLGQLFVFSGDEFTGGNGGLGVVGGNGGSVFGASQKTLVSNETNSFNFDGLTVIGGIGADGISGGGSGGSITNFTSEFLPLVGGTGGGIFFEAGNGGTAVGGHGGGGGSVIGDSPSGVENNLAGPISLFAGAGGNGLSGGAGGSVISFVQQSTILEPPTIFTILAGAGGNGTLGNGGAGGAATNITLAASGNIETEVGGILTGTIIPSYNRLIAGQGGISTGATGGAGGGLANDVTASVASDTEMVGAAGAGGAGLIAGGAGGGVNFVSLDAGSLAGSQNGKVLIVAGDGGASTSVAAAGKDAVSVAASLGGVNGPGGNGGSINSFTQPTSVTTHVDLIAGNGGATLDHSVFAGNAKTDNSGKGGSMNTINVTGSIGNSDPNVTILSYNNIDTGESIGTFQEDIGGFLVTQTGPLQVGTTMQDFINVYVVNDFASINDSVGNVGLVAGAAGRVEGTTIQANTSAPVNGINGSVTNVHASNIMSMIAGNVEQVDLIQNLSNFGVVNGGIIGAPKFNYFNPVSMTIEGSGQGTLTPADTTLLSLGYIIGQDNYYSGVVGASGTSTIVRNPLPGGGGLIDGAILAKNVAILTSSRQF